MNFSDRHSALLTIGLALLGSLSGCHTAHQSAAVDLQQNQGYGAMAAANRRHTVLEAPRTRGPSEPVPLAEADVPFDRPVFPPAAHEESPAGRGYDRGPTLRGFPVEEPDDEDVEDDAPRFPGANRRASASGKSPARSTAASGRSGGTSSTRTTAGGSEMQWSASHKALGHAATARSATPRTADSRSAAISKPPSRKPGAIPVAAAEREFAEVDDEDDRDEVGHTSPQFERMPLPLTTRHPLRAASRGTNGFESFEESGAETRSEPIRVAHPPMLLTPPSETR